MSVTRFGIIGYGETGKAYAGAIEESADAVVAATSGPGGEGDRYLHFESADGLIARNDIDAIVFAGAPSNATPTIVAALERGFPVLCAGPPGCTVDDAAAISGAAPGTTLYFANPIACHGSVIRASSIVEQGTLGRVLTVRAVYGGSGVAEGEEASWRADYALSGGGVLMSVGYQLISLLQDLCGRVEDVASMISSASPGPQGMEDNAFGLLRHSSGTVSQVHASMTQWRHMFRVELGLEKGYLWLDGLMPEDSGFTPEMLISARVRLDENDCPRPNPAEEVRAFEEDTALNRVLSGFLRSVGGEPVPQHASLEAASDALDTVHRLYAADPAWPRA